MFNPKNNNKNSIFNKNQPKITSMFSSNSNSNSNINITDKINSHELSEIKNQNKYQNDQGISSYLGEKGYTIYKSALPKEELNFIKNELTVRPFIPKSPIQPPSFPIYRESNQKIYIPRYFGYEYYGKPDESRISQGEDIQLIFNGTLRDYQQEVVKLYLNQVRKDEFGGGGLLDLATGSGKTVLALNIISQLNKKTLIIVHKSFLLNQWLERITQYLPLARVGRIQGQIIDIENKDIVIGMLQSLSMKEYPGDMFKSFGLTVVDEVHHISSEVFSRSLLKIVTKYTLGLSATMQRKDGLTKVFKMYLGDILYKSKTNKGDKVLVKAIEYSVQDSEFNEVEYDYRGNPKFSTMMTKLCSFNPRSEYILSIIKNELEENPDQQMIVLAHNKNILTYLHDGIKHRNIASSSVGYYLGGMKAEDLKQSESKKIIIATYAMASEGLDIPTLTTVLFATPKTDITQSVGRILRVKHSNPLVIDIVDCHDLFKKQWLKRKEFYIKNNYKIIYNKKYKPGTRSVFGVEESETNPDWKVVFDPENDIVPKLNINKCLVQL
jgi:superfamily II DNA or RNA helicase